MTTVTYTGGLAAPVEIHHPTHGDAFWDGDPIDVDPALAVTLVATGEWAHPTATGEPPVDGTITEVHDWVGDDPARAAQALAAEQARPTPRSTLVAALSAAVAAVTTDPTDQES